MGLHEIAIGGIFISPLLVYAILALPVTKGIMMLIHKTPLSRWIWHEMLFVCALYVCVCTVVTLSCAILF